MLVWSVGGGGRAEYQTEPHTGPGRTLASAPGLSRSFSKTSIRQEGRLALISADNSQPVYRYLYVFLYRRASSAVGGL